MHPVLTEDEAQSQHISLAGAQIKPQSRLECCAKSRQMADNIEQEIVS